MTIISSNAQSKNIISKLIIAAFVFILPIAACDQIDEIFNDPYQPKLMPVERSASEQTAPIVMVVIGKSAYKIDDKLFSEENIIEHLSKRHNENPNINILLLGDSSRKDEIEKLSRQLSSNGFRASMIISRE
ncbi:MAG: hypothetical protein L3J04_00025 [Robiginitomaculum sp.]|nr:hypothetical protein [Robiginitomaculum sp.]